MTGEQLLPVEQADRSAMVEYYVGKGMQRCIAIGVVDRRDASDAMLQMLAAHRLATTPTALPGAEDVALRAAIEGLRFIAAGHGCPSAVAEDALAKIANSIPRASEEVPANPVGEGLVEALDGAEAISINKGKSVVIDFDKSGQAFALYNILLKAALSADAASSQEQGA